MISKGQDRVGAKASWLSWGLSGGVMFLVSLFFFFLWFTSKTALGLGGTGVTGGVLDLYCPIQRPLAQAAVWIQLKTELFDDVATFQVLPGTRTWPSHKVLLARGTLR